MSTDERGPILLAIARAAISSALGKPLQADESAAWLQEPGATFVTLTQHGELRGCIGSLEAHRPLLADVKANALAAAFRDPRFAPLAEDELDDDAGRGFAAFAALAHRFRQRAGRLAQLRPNVDGVVFEYGAYRSTFLPQVWEQLPEPAEFMAHLKYKAGLSAGLLGRGGQAVALYREQMEGAEIIMKTAESNYPGRYWHALEDDRIQCDLCPRDCKLHEGQRGLCFVRQNIGGQMVLTTYGRSSGFCIDPIEKKPLNHFYPGSSVFSFGTAGCNLACKFCQNWDISKAKDMDRLMDQASPEEIARTAEHHGCKSVAFTYNDPVIFAEYAMDTADACHARGIKTVAVTAGYIHDAGAARVLRQDGCRQRRPERLHRRLLPQAVRRPSAAGAGHPELRPP